MKTPNSIKKSLEKVNAIKYWKNVITTYNKIPFIKKVNPELEAYKDIDYTVSEGFSYRIGFGSDTITRANGTVEGVIDFTGIRDLVKKSPDLDVMNGIAYNPKTDRLYVTGKNWDKLFEIQLVENN